MSAADLLRPELDMQCPVEFGTVPDCQCPWEHWHLRSLGGSCLDVHLEEDGSAHFIYSGDGVDVEREASGLADLAQAREAAFAWVAHEVCEFDIEAAQ